MLPARSKYFVFFIGALLIAALLFFSRSKKEQGSEIAAIKPSQLDFAQENTPSPSVTDIAVTPAPSDISEVSKEPESFKKLSAKDAERILILDEILKSKNDNDARMDQEFRTMSSALHEALYDKYDLMVSEDRNGRGTVAFLIARDLKSQQDADFLKQVFNESPCTSMAHCNQVSQEDPHMGGVEQTSLNYPQLATLYQLEGRLEKNPDLIKDRSFKGWVSEVIRQAKAFPVPMVQDKAEQIAQKYNL